MNNQQLVLDTLGKLRGRFPKVFRGITGLPVETWDWQDEAGTSEVLEDLVREADSEALNDFYAQRLTADFEKTHGLNAGVAMVRASLEERARALSKALDDIG